MLDLVPVGEDLVEAERELFGLVFVAQCRQGLAGGPLQWVEPDLGRAAGMVWGGPPRFIPVGVDVLPVLKDGDSCRAALRGTSVGSCFTASSQGKPWSYTGSTGV